MKRTVAQSPVQGLGRHHPEIKLTQITDYTQNPPNNNWRKYHCVQKKWEYKRQRHIARDLSWELKKWLLSLGR